MSNAALPLIFGALGGIQGGATALASEAKAEAEEERRIGFQRLLQQYRRDDIDYQNKLTRANLAEDRTYNEGEKAKDREYAEGRDEINRARTLADQARNRTESMEDYEKKLKLQHQFDDKRTETEKLYDFVAKKFGPEEANKMLAGKLGGETEPIMKQFNALSKLYGPEEAARMIHNEQNAKGKTGLSEVQMLHAQEKLSALEDVGIDSRNYKTANVYRRTLGLPEYSPTVTEKGDKGFLGTGFFAKKDIIEYLPADTGSSAPSNSGLISSGPAAKDEGGNKKETVPNPIDGGQSKTTKLTPGQVIEQNGVRFVVGKDGIPVQSDAKVSKPSSKAAESTEKTSEEDARIAEMDRYKAVKGGGLISSAGVDEAISGAKEIGRGAIEGAKTGWDIYMALMGEPAKNAVNGWLSESQKQMALATLDAKYKNGIVSVEEYKKARALLNQ